MKNLIASFLLICMLTSSKAQMDRDQLTINPATSFFGAMITFFRIDNQVEMYQSYNNGLFMLIYKSQFFDKDPFLNITKTLLVRSDAQGVYKYRIKLINGNETNIFNPWNIVANVNLTDYNGSILVQGREQDYIIHISANSKRVSKPGEITYYDFTISKNWSAN